MAGFDGGISVATVQGIKVDLPSFGVVRDTLRDQVDFTLNPYVNQVLDRCNVDPGVGTKNPSGIVAAFRDQYGLCLQDTVDRLLKFVSESNLLVDVATEILTRYSTVDQLAATSVQDITDMFTWAQDLQSNLADTGE